MVIIIMIVVVKNTREVNFFLYAKTAGKNETNPTSETNTTNATLSRTIQQSLAISAQIHIFIRRKHRTDR